MHDPLALPQETVGDHYTVGHERIRGEVFEIQRAHEKVSGREVGILRLTPMLENDSACVTAFLDWAALATRWQVRHALAVFGIARDFGGVYVVCEWPAGGTLESRVRERTLDESRVASIRASIAESLADAANHGLAHGRIVPEEVLLGADGAPRLAVFGIGLADDEMSTLLVDENGGSPVRRLPVSAEDDARRLAMLGKADSRAPFRREGRTDHLATRTAPARERDSDDSSDRGEFPWRPLSEQYRVEDQLGAGGMGSVFRALELATGRTVAVKRMKNADPSAIKRFRREASAIARLNHPHVLQLMQAARDEEGDYLVLECAPNGSLADRLKKDGKLPAREVLEIARKIGAALTYAHGKGCIHRDVKPHNILLSESNEPKLADFGLARALDDVTLTTSSAGAGSPVYMPPEQWQDGKKADARSDVYAFAKTLYHLLTGEKPAAIDRRLVTPAVHAVLKRATEQESEDRYDSIAAFVAELEAAMGAPSSTASSGAPGAANRIAMVSGLAVLALAIAAFTLRDHPSLARILGTSTNDSPAGNGDPARDRDVNVAQTKPGRDDAPNPVQTPLSKARFDDFVGRPLSSWDDVAAALEAAPHYGGLALKPQSGLAPLRIDSLSKLAEFVHLGSGIAPDFKGSGRYGLTEETGIVLVLVPGGEFEMGAQARSQNEPMYDSNARDDESPVSRVTLAPYFLGKYEITQAQWSRLAGANPSRAKPGTLEGADFTLLHPVENVSFADARAALDSSGLTLPTEAQWEHACRAGTRTSWFCGPRAEMLERYANLADARTRSINPDAFGHLKAEQFAPFSDPHANTSPIHAHAGNAFGFHDLSGNVAEWCLDAYGSYSIEAREGDGGRGVDAPGNRVVRGGSFAFGPDAARSAARAQAAADLARPFIGVRAARAVER